MDYHYLTGIRIFCKRHSISGPHKDKSQREGDDEGDLRVYFVEIMEGVVDGNKQSDSTQWAQNGSNHHAQ